MSDALLGTVAFQGLREGRLAGSWVPKKGVWGLGFPLR